MSNRLKNIAARLRGPVNPDATTDELERGVLYREAVDCPIGATLQYRGDVLELAGAHRRTRQRWVGRMTHDGQAVAVPKREREVVAVTRDGQRIPFHPQVWRQYVDAVGMGGYR